MYSSSSGIDYKIRNNYIKSLVKIMIFQIKDYPDFANLHSCSTFYISASVFWDIAYNFHRQIAFLSCLPIFLNPFGSELFCHTVAIIFFLKILHAHEYFTYVGIYIF